MELSSIKHIDSSQIADYKADLFITSLGFESRSNLVARKFENLSCKKIALEIPNPIREFSFKDNKKYLENQGFEFILVESGLPDPDRIFQSLKGNSINVAIDSTNMPPSWYYEFFKWFDGRQARDGRIRMRIAYTMAAYVSKPGARKVKKIFNLVQDEVRASNSRKTALILGLGHEKLVSESVYNMINPDLLYLYYADPPAEKRFVEKVFVNNYKLINQAPIRNLVAYPIRNGQDIYHSLINTILPLRNEYNIELIPHGPKIFSLVSMLVHLGYPDIRISYPRFKKQVIADRQPKDDPVVLDILFEGEE
jgi:hypothetical protein